MIDPEARAFEGGEEVVICSQCGWENPASRLTCTWCGEKLIALEGKDILPDPVHPHPETGSVIASYQPAWEDIGQTDKPVTRLQLVFSVGIVFLIILVASIIFQVLQPVSRVILIVGIFIGFGGTYIITDEEPSTSSEEGGSPSKSPLPGWLTFPVFIIGGIIVIIFGFGYEFILSWFFSKNPGERVLALVLGGLCGITIELSLGNISRAITYLRSS